MVKISGTLNELTADPKKMMKALKKQSIPVLKKKLDKVFSEYIRRRDSGDGKGGGLGYCICITCANIAHWKKMDNGHYIKRQYMATRYDEWNCNAQCKCCNWLEQGANEKYKVALDKKWGQGAADMLEQKKHNIMQMTAFEYGVLIRYYQDKIKEM